MVLSEWIAGSAEEAGFLKLVLDAAWRGIGLASPNRVDGGALRMLQMARRTVVDTSAVVALLSAPNA